MPSTQTLSGKFIDPLENMTVAPAMVQLPKPELLMTLNHHPAITKNLNFDHLSIHSVLSDLPLSSDALEIDCLGKEVVHKFQENHHIPGVIFTKSGEFYGMISRRKFLERMSLPYALEIFLKRPIYTLKNLDSDIFQSHPLPENLSILKAVQYALQRPAEKVYEPLVIQQASGNYGLLDIHDLLVAQSHIHKLTHTLLKEKTSLQIMQSEKMANLGRMVAEIAHEIRNPVNCIHGNIAFLKNYFADLIELVQLYQQETAQTPVAIADFLEKIEFEFLQEDLSKIIDTLEVSAVRTAKIVKSLHSFSRLDEKAPQLMSIPHCLEGTLLILNNRIKNKVQINTDYDDHLPEILGYSGQLSQVFMNLLVNALDALEEKNIDFTNAAWQPTIDIKVTRQSVTVNEASDTDWVCIQITDNANGMPQSVQAQVFEDFFTTKPLGKGTGLGLAISHEIVTQKHQGKLEFTSMLGQGTTFSIWLPIRVSLQAIAA